MRDPHFSLDSARRSSFAASEASERPLPSHPEVEGQRELSLSDFVDCGRLPIDDAPADAACVVLPEPFEPRYSYPLIVWLHEQGGCEDDIEAILPAISDRNYIGIGVRAPLRNRDGEGYCWPEWSDDLEAHLAAVRTAVTDVRRELNIHSERIYIAGADEGGTLALQMLLQRPNWFAGAVNWHGRLPEGDRPLQRFRELVGKPVLLVSPSERMHDGTAASQQRLRALQNGVLRVTTQTAGKHVKALRGIDHWLMGTISQPACV